jgi:hypothetical protein
MQDERDVSEKNETKETLKWGGGEGRDMNFNYFLFTSPSAWIRDAKKRQRNLESRRGEKRADRERLALEQIIFLFVNVARRHGPVPTAHVQMAVPRRHSPVPTAHVQVAVPFLCAELRPVG